MRIWAVGTTRNEVDLIRANVLHHHAQGIEKMLLVDNDSRDGTRDVLQELAAMSLVEWQPYRGPFRQNVLLTELARRAHHSGADWVIPIDADEFWYAPDGNIQMVLENHDVDAVRVQLRNFVQHRDQRYNTPEALLRMTRTVPEPLGAMQEAEALVESETIAYVEHLYHYKWIHRASHDLSIGWGNHTIDTQRSSAPTDGILCLHAPLRSYEVLEAKVDADRPAREIDDYFAIAWHLRRWRRLAWEGRLEDEWRANSYLDDALDLYGRARPLVVDNRLHDLLRPWIKRP
jgi:glycosyltransferase involved in cell wall biosynthesis